MRVIFRTDASTQIGTGHVMRCLTLADALRERGARCGFVCREHPGHLLDLIRARGHEARALPLSDAPPASRGGVSHDHADWLGADWGSDAQQTLAAMHGVPVDWLVVDHYALDARWEKQLGAHCGKLLVIDDLADRQHECDLLLDQNLNRNASDYRAFVLSACKVLIGPKYALLRPDFNELRKYSLDRRDRPNLRHVLICMGGVDKDNVTGQVLSAVSEVFFPPLESLTIVLGPKAPWIGTVRAQAAEMRATKVLVNVQNMSELMADSDLAIGAAGSTAWERCCLGLPTLMMVLAENQREAASAIQRAGAAVIIDSNDNLKCELVSHLAALIRDQGKLAQMSHCASRITKGEGVFLVANEMMGR